jgi:hypothetical protein
MPGSNFDNQFAIAAGGQIAPGGPLDHTAGWSSGTTKANVLAAGGAIKLYVWVLQSPPAPGGSGAFLGAPAAPMGAGGNRWSVAAPGATQGQFQSGTALGMAVQVWEGPAGDPTRRVHWWSETIHLT